MFGRTETTGPVTDRRLGIAGNGNLALLTCAVLMAAWNGPAHAQSDGASWLQRIDDAERVPHSYGVMRQTITTSGGSLRTFTVRSWSAENGDVSLMAYDEPARVAGDKILLLDGGDNIWYYMRRRDVTRHFAGHTRNQSAMGSDFSYEDLVAGDFDDNLSRRIEYFEEDEHTKTLFLTEFQVVDNRKTPFKMDMVNHREGSRTLMETVEITFTDEPDPSLFTRAALTRRIR